MACYVDVDIETKFCFFFVFVVELIVICKSIDDKFTNAMFGWQRGEQSSTFIFGVYIFFCERTLHREEF